MCEQKNEHLNTNTSSNNTTADEVSVKVKKWSSRNFFLTLNQVDKYDELKTYLFKHKKQPKYYLCCEHLGQSHQHYHIYVQYGAKVDLYKSKLCGANVSDGKNKGKYKFDLGDSKTMIAYCKCTRPKDIKKGKTAKIIEEEGEPLKWGGCRSIKAIKEMNDDELEELDGVMFNTIMKIRGPPKIKVGEWKKEVEAIYIYGPSEFNKSELCEQIMEKSGIDEFQEIKYNGHFWLGIGGTEITGTAIYDDWRDSHMRASEFINFIDYRIHNMEFKGSYAKNKLSLIIITSVQSPYEIYKNMGDEPKHQWLRRLTIIEKYGPKVEQYVFKKINEFSKLFKDEVVEDEVYNKLLE